MTSSTDTKQSQSTTAPWAPQQPYILQGLQDAQGAYNQAKGAPTPTNFVAGLTPGQISTFNNMVGYGNNNSLPGTLSSSGVGSLNTGTGALSGAASGYGGFNPNATNNMGANIAGANAYASGINIPGQVRNAMQTAMETARDVTLPGMEANAASNGNINSSRTGLAEGLVQRGLAEQAGNLAATIGNNAYATGANLASNTNTVNNAATLSALSGEGGLGLGALSSGNNALNSSIAGQGSLFDIAGAGGGGLQSGNQADLSNQLQKWQFGTQSPFAGLNQYMSIVGAPFGQQTNGTSTETKTPSFMDTLGGLIGSGTSLMGGIFGGNGLFGANGAFGKNGYFGNSG